MHKTRQDKTRQNGSKLILLICCVFIIITALFKPRWTQERSGTTISWDVSGYYSYLPALFIYKDIKQLDFLETITKQYQPTSGYVNANTRDNGNRVIVYPAGQAIAYLPAFFTAHLLARNSDYPADGYSFPYQICLSWWSLFIGFLGLFYARKNLLNYFSDQVTSIVLLILVFGTNYLNYVAFDHAMTHNYLFTYYAILIFYTQKLYQSPSFSKATMIGALLGLIILTRPSELVAVFIPLLWGVASWKNLNDRLIVWKQHYPKIVTAFLVTFAIGAIQFIYWKYLTGDFLFYSYQENGFNWLKPNVINVFFSFKKGWLIYTPLITFALVGLIPLYRNYKQLFWSIICFLIPNIYIICAWDIWWYGGSFGQRAMVQSYALLLFPLAALVNVIYTYKWYKYGFFACVVFGTSLNLFQMWQIQTGIIHSDGISKAYYKRIFFNSNPTPTDRFLLDIKTDYNGQRKNIKELLYTSFEATDRLSTQTSLKYAKTGRQSTFVDINSIYSQPTDVKINSENILPASWLRVSAHFYCEWKEWTTWKMPKLLVQLYDGNKLVAQEKIRPNRVFFEKRWEAIHMDFPVPQKDFNRIKVTLWNPGKSQQAMYMDDLKVELYEIE